MKRAWRLTIQKRRSTFRRFSLQSYPTYVALKRMTIAINTVITTAITARMATNIDARENNMFRDWQLFLQEGQKSEIIPIKDHIVWLMPQLRIAMPQLRVTMPFTSSFLSSYWEPILSHQSLLSYWPTTSSIHRLFNRPILKSETFTLTIPESTSRRGDGGGECRGSPDCVSHWNLLTTGSIICSATLGSNMTFTTLKVNGAYSITPWQMNAKALRIRDFILLLCV